MKIITDEIGILNKTRKKAYDLSEKALIVSKPEQAKIFLTDIQKKIFRTRNTYKKLIYQVRLYKHLTHEVENLFDNYYIVDNTISDILNSKIDKGFKKLVQIEKKPNLFIPRIYSILSDLLKVTEYRIDRDILYCFLQAYQTKAHLSIRELSFVPFFLKIILIENIENVMLRSISALDEYKDAEYWFEQIVKKEGRNKELEYSNLTSNLTHQYGVIPVNLGFYLLQKLSQYGPDTRPIVKWLKLNLLKQGINISDLAEIENKRQTDISLQVSNIKKSLYWINQARWDDFVVDVNTVDSFLTKDPAGVYGILDQASQSAYRNEVVKISDRAGVYESEVAKLTLRLCHQTSTNSKVCDNPENHIGYYLFGAGRDELERKVGYQKPFGEKLQTYILKRAAKIYLGLILLINIIFTTFFILLFPTIFRQAFFLSLITSFVFILNCDVVINLVNIAISSLIPVRSLFRLDLSKGVLTRQATFVVMPSMFRDEKSTKELLRRLEVNYLSNNNDNVYFALLLGFKNSTVEVETTDQILVDQMNKGIEALNRKYPAVIRKFYLFHRRRIWNSRENAFIEWERKRGKIREFNQLLRGKTNTSFFEDLPRELPYIRYVITIDEDTRLPKDSVIKLIGCIDHPLNRPVVDNTTHRVIGGYGIIQPRMTTRFSQAKATIFSSLFSSAMGIDSYSGPVADVYQDLFNNSIFYGKGIYDVDTMEMTIGDRIPENQVLSHDLLEGLYTRVGFATDIFLFEGFPESYKEYILRMHRWIRGDWQIISWLKNGGIKGNNFNFSDKWKIFDNLRRSTLPIFSVLFLLFSYLFFRNFYHISLLYILLVIGSPFIISYLFRSLEWPREMTGLMKINTLIRNLSSVLWQIIYRYIFLLDQAIISVRAIMISVYRMVFSHQNMLRWHISHEVAKKVKGTLREFIYLMLPTEIVSLLLLILLLNYPDGFSSYFTLILWLISPLVAFYISQKKEIYKYQDDDIKLLRRIAYRSARFFFEMSEKDGNQLIPDHYQEEPVTYSPAATSPTNIGMHLLSNFSAYDFGYVSFSNLLERTQKLFQTLDSLERYRGHFYNWYDIRTLQPLNPKYVSSADSANMLISLITLKQGIIDIIAKPLLKANLDGVLDILAVLIEDANLICDDRTILRSERKLAKRIYDEANLIINKYSFNQTNVSIEQLAKKISSLADSNEKIKKIVSNLNLTTGKTILASIYSSTEHLNILLKQYTGDLDFFMFYNQTRLDRPVIHNENKNFLLAKALQEISLKLDLIPSLEYLSGGLKSEIEGLNFTTLIQSANLNNSEKEKIERWYEQVIKSLTLVETRAKKSKADYFAIISVLDKFFTETDFAFLYNKERGLFHIGYNVTYEKIDNSYYDFLASEANSISFVSILKGEIPIKHWFYLGRKLVRLDMNNVLLSSWGGSLFEYLTSLIFFKVHPESLLGHTAQLAVEGHIKYGQKYQIPWGMGESAYSALDLNSNYQYQIFGHPVLGFRRDLKDYLVVAPYTTIMSLAFKPKEAITNLRQLIKSKLMGRYGFYDAIDYTSSMDNKWSKKVGIPVKIYYAHHQGFSLQSLNNQINQNRLQTLFASDPRVESLDTLFEEKIPSSIPARPIKSLERLQTEYLVAGTNNIEAKQFIPLFTSYPRRAFISNGAYTVNISNTGAGGSKVSDICLTRFQEDTVAESWGQFIYLYDSAKESLWSPTTQPTGISLGKNKIEFFENKAHFSKIHNEIESSLIVAVAADSNVEFRTLTLTNHSKDKKNLKIASYGEVSLAKSDEDLQHPAFEKLFIKSEYWQKYNALIYTKPSKIDRNKSLYFAHRLITTSSKLESVHTTDRNQFIIRGGSLREPNIFSLGQEKIKSALGYNFEPIFCFQNKIELKPNETMTVIYVNIFSQSKEELIRNLKRYSTGQEINHAIKKSDKLGSNIISSLGLSSDQALNYQALASRFLSPHYSQEIKKLKEGIGESLIQTLWRLGISDNLPIIIVRFYDLNDLAMVKNMLLCHRYLKYKGIAHDLVLLNEYPASYVKSLEDEIDFLLRYDQSPINKAVRGGIFHLRSSHLAPYDKENLISLSKILLDSKLGTIEQQILAILQSSSRTPATYFKATKKAISSGRDVFPDLAKFNFFNGFGGFDLAGEEYVVNVNYKKSVYTPTPWVNIITNKNIGYIITESGSMFTWLFDSYDNRLTQRTSDSLTDRSSEIFYLRDEETGEFWNPTPLPIKSSHTYTIRHGLGYTKIEHKSHGLEQEMLTFVPLTDSVKIIKFKFNNTAKIIKKLSLTGFFEMSLGGVSREYTKDYLKTSIDSETGALLVKNVFNESFKDCIAFVDLNNGKNIFTNDRDEFLGKGGVVSNPSAMRRDKLSNIIYDDVDHCIALETFFELQPGQEMEIVALLGGGQSMSEVQNLIRKYRSLSHCQSAFDTIKLNWNELTNKITIKTPDESLNILFNSRLLYQLISSRLLARTGYYQPSGAYGFRDQLQDSMALVWSNPVLAKEIILKASRHQFLEGDVMNWWHEHNSFGIRNVSSDHQLWLPYVTCFYLDITADLKILDEKESYLKAPVLDFLNNPNWAGVPEKIEEKYDLYDHCLRAIERTLVFGKNGLPLIGLGDWNDGLNKVGEKGLGESVWLGWFLHSVIEKFIPYVKDRGDYERIKRYEIILKNLKNSLESNAWDGKWYKRAFFDNGSSLGSSSNREFKIDSISQSWSVLSGAAKPERSKIAMNSTVKNLSQDNNLWPLIFPALKDLPMDPGYIKDYPPGVRENGAQYNHAALWLAQAFAELKDSANLIKIIDSVNPIKRSSHKDKALLYRVEPYVVASDIYAKPTQAGRGGWTWYTGSAGLMYRTILENLLGLKIKGDKMEINPCLPKEWPDCSFSYSYKDTKYNIHILNNSNDEKKQKKIIIDGHILAGTVINLLNDNKIHQVEVKL